MPESASFSVRKKTNYRRRRTFAVLGLLVAVVIILLVLPRGDGTGRPPGEETPVVAFTRSVSVVALKQPEAAARQANVEAVATMVRDFYQSAFVDPKKWGDGTFPDLKALFSDEAQAAFTKDVASLTIGQARTQLKFVDPRASTLGVTVFFDTKAAPTFAVAAVSFNARGTLKQSGPPLLIKQKASFYMERSGDKWLITAFDAEQTQETPPSPSPSPTAS
jgi:hypothetical protein